GEGGAGCVYEVTDQESKTYALKLLSANVVSTEKVKRFKNEMNFLSKNRHDNIVAVLDSGFITDNDKKLPFYVMPRYRQTLRTLITSKIQIDKVLPYFSQILDGVEALHLKGVWHRDLKPENVLYDDSVDKLLIADLGVAHFEEENLHTSIETKPNSRLANFEYAAPEQRRKGMSVDSKADIYALGLILNEMFTGDVLQGTGHKTIATVAPNYSYLDDLVDLMVRQSLDDRPNSIDSLKQELIGRRNDFIQRQKISDLEKTVISTSEVDDILIADPIKIIGLDYKNTYLELKLNHTVNQDWINIFKKVNYFNALIGSLPEDFNFNRNVASVRITDTRNLQIIVDSFKSYLGSANQNYKTAKENQVKANERMQREALRAQIEKEKKELELRNLVMNSISY
ncbi:MAG: serine/threonine-protein kinase, partial [Pyrinomonadaceae bacterium]